MAARLQNQNARIRKSDDAVLTGPLEDGTSVLLNVESKYYFSLNETGTFIWRYIEDHPSVSVQDLFEAMKETYAEVEEDILADDLNDFIGNLKNEKMIEIEN